jgi:integrase
LLAALPDDLRMLVRFAITTSARLDTILRLRWQDIDDANGIVTLQNVKSTTEGETHTLPITPEVRAILGSRRGQHPEFVFSYRCSRGTRDRTGGVRKAGQRYPFSDTGWRKVWKRALAAAGVADFRFHDTRHTAATRITRATGNLRLTQRVLGHKNIATTQRYAHVLLEDVAAGMQAASQNLPESETPRAATPGVSIVHTGTYEENRRDGTSTPKAGALPG